jgi:hypothetical protein
MTTATKPLSEIAAQWREARQLYEVYSALLENFALGLPPCRDLESPIDKNDPQAIERVQQWFVQMDDRVHVHQLRQLLQTSRLGTEENLRALVRHHIGKEKKTEGDRDKIDFLLVQYLSSTAPPAFYDKSVSFEEIAQLLEPLLGEVGAHPPKWQEPLEKATDSLDNVRSLRELLEQGTLDQMRKLKVSAGDMYFGPTALVAITRFNFFVRRTFVRLIASDLHAIRFSLNELERRNVKCVDCSRAKLGAKESIESLRKICQEWKKPFRAAYAAGQNFRELVEIRSALEDALAHAPEPGAAPSSASVEEEAPEPQSAASMQATESAASSAAAPATEPEKKAAAAPPLPASAPAPKEESAAPKAEPEAAKPQAAAADGHPTDLQSTLEHIAEELRKLNIKDAAVANVVLGGVKLMLSTWEVGAYVKGGDDTADTLQQAVAARAMLAAQLDLRKKGQPVDMSAVIKTAELESKKIQAQIAVAKQAKDIDAAVNLAATSKRLSGLLDEAAKPAK